MVAVNKRVFPFVVFLIALFFTISVPEAIVFLDQNAALATMSVDPPTLKAPVGQSFTVNINISGVVDLYGWEFKLRWNNSVLDAVEVTEGPFLKGGSNTFFTFTINNTAGYILVDCTLLGNVPGVSGSGILLTVKFYVKKIGKSILDLYDSVLVNSQEQPITHTTTDGYYYTLVHDVAIIGLSSSQTTVLVTAENQGTETETFDVSTYYVRLADPLIETQTITLASKTNTTLTFSWAPPSPGRYEITAQANTVLGEVDTADNTRSIITLIGYGGGSSQSPRARYDSARGSSIAAFISTLFATAIIVPKFRREMNCRRWTEKERVWLMVATRKRSELESTSSSDAGRSYASKPVFKLQPPLTNVKIESL